MHNKWVRRHFFVPWVRLYTAHESTVLCDGDVACHPALEVMLGGFEWTLLKMALVVT